MRFFQLAFVPDLHLSHSLSLSLSISLSRRVVTRTHASLREKKDDGASALKAYGVHTTRAYYARITGRFSPKLTWQTTLSAIRLRNSPRSSFLACGKIYRPTNVPRCISCGCVRSFSLVHYHASDDLKQCPRMRSLFRSYLAQRIFFFFFFYSCLPLMGCPYFTKETMLLFKLLKYCRDIGW